MESYRIVPFCLALFTQCNDFEIHLCGCVNSPLLFMTEWCPTVWIYHNLFIHSLADGYLSCFQFLAIINKVDMNGQVFVWIYMLSFG